MENDIVEETKEEAPIDPMLLEKMTALRTLTRLDTLIQNCLFPGGAAVDIVAARGFIETLHAPILKECQAHPDFQRASMPQAEYEALKKAEAKRQRKLHKVEEQ